MIIFSFFAKFFLLGLHILYSFYLNLKFFRAAVNKLRYKLQTVSINKKKLQEIEEEVIEKHVKRFPKIPKHLMVSLGEEEPHYSDLVQIAIWSISSSIPIVSFYDYKDDINAAKFYETFQQQFPELMYKIKWGVSFKKESNGVCSNGNGVIDDQIQINVLSSKHGRQMIIDTVFDLCNTKTIIEDRKEMELALDKLILSKLECSPDPDLMIICGDLYTTYGFSPWNVSFTEFALVPSYRFLTVRDFVNILAVYANCAQNWGT